HLTRKVHQRARATCGFSNHNRITFIKRTFLNQNSGHWTTTRFNFRFNYDTLCWTFWILTELHDLRLKLDGLKQVIDAFTGVSRYVYVLSLTTPVFREKFELSQALLHLIWVSGWLIDFVNCNDDRNISVFTELDTLNGLRHYTVVGCHYQ